jgi:hypothetical protein
LASDTGSIRHGDGTRGNCPARCISTGAAQLGRAITVRFDHLVIESSENSVTGQPGDPIRISPGHRITVSRRDRDTVLRGHQVAGSPSDPAIALRRDAVTGSPGRAVIA